MPDVFVTGTFRNEWNKKFNMMMTDYLERHGLKCYLPQRDTEQSGNRRVTFNQNITGIDSCRVLLAIGAKTQTANWGLEIGYAFAKGKPVFVLTDADHPVELMPAGAAAENIIIANDLNDLDSYGPKLKQVLGSAAHAVER